MAVHDFDVSELDDILQGTRRYWRSQVPDDIGLSGDQVKCNRCKWATTRLFVQADSRDAAVELLKSGERGLCGECFSEFLVAQDNPYEIKLSPGAFHELYELVHSDAEISSEVIKAVDLADAAHQCRDDEE